MNSGIGDFARCLVGGVRRGTRKPYGVTKASPSETDTKSARLERICTIWEERFSWKVELESGRFWLLPKWQWKVLCQNFGCE